MRVKKDKSKAGYKSGPLDNQKWENFARYIANGETQANAAKLAGFKENNAHIRGCVLMKNPAIKIRVDELKRVSSEQAVMGLALNKSWVLQKLKENVEAARKEDDHSAVNRGLELIGKEIRMFVDRQVIGLQDLRSASADDLYDILAEIDSALGAQQQAEVVASLEPGKPGGEDPGECVVRGASPPTTQEGFDHE